MLFQTYCSPKPYSMSIYIYTTMHAKPYVLELTTETILISFVSSQSLRSLPMDVTIVRSGEKPFKMEIWFFAKVIDIKKQLQKHRGYPVGAQTLFRNGQKLSDDDADTERYGILEGSVIDVVVATGDEGQKKAPAYWVKATSMGGERSLDVAVDPRGAVSELRRELERAQEEEGFPLPGEGGYFFIHRQRVLDDRNSFLSHRVEAGDEIVVFNGWVDRQVKGAT